MKELNQICFFIHIFIKHLPKFTFFVKDRNEKKKKSKLKESVQFFLQSLHLLHIHYLLHYLLHYIYSYIYN